MRRFFPPYGFTSCFIIISFTNMTAKKYYYLEKNSIFELKKKVKSKTNNRK